MSKFKNKKKILKAAKADIIYKRNPTRLLDNFCGTNFAGQKGEE